MVKQHQTLTERRMKTLLIRHLKQIGEARGAVVLNELFVGNFSRRADVVLVNGKLSVFEIKGELDSLDRLPGQLSTFSEYFEAVTVVCAPKHSAKVQEITPANIGVWEIDNENVSILRPGDRLFNMDVSVWLSYLPVRELKSLLAERGLRSAGNKRENYVSVARALPLEEIRKVVLTYLKSRSRSGNLVNKLNSREFPTIDPVEKNLLRVQEFLGLMGGAGASIKAIPRRSPSHR